MAEKTLYTKADSSYMGANVPGKPRVFMMFIGGLDRYVERCDAIVREGCLGFCFFPIKVRWPWITAVPPPYERIEVGRPGRGLIEQSERKKMKAAILSAAREATSIEAADLDGPRSEEVRICEAGSGLARPPHGADRDSSRATLAVGGCPIRLGKS